MSINEQEQSIEILKYSDIDDKINFNITNKKVEINLNNGNTYMKLHKVPFSRLILPRNDKDKAQGPPKIQLQIRSHEKFDKTGDKASECTACFELIEAQAIQFLSTNSKELFEEELSIEGVKERFYSEIRNKASPVRYAPWSNPVAKFRPNYSTLLQMVGLRRLIRC